MGLSITPPPARGALYYPFHLCHERTLERLLREYQSVHFRDYMALQLTAMSGTTAYADRMGDLHGDLVKAGRIVQGYQVSGPLDAEMVAAVDRDLADQVWRVVFHSALLEDRRFQRGLFDLSHGMIIGGSLVPGPAALLELAHVARAHRAFSVGALQRLCGCPLTTEDGYDYEYGLALVKTSASLAYTIRLSLQYALEAVTDSETHFRLLERTCARDKVSLSNRWILRAGY